MSAPNPRSECCSREPCTYSYFTATNGICSYIAAPVLCYIIMLAHFASLFAVRHTHVTQFSLFSLCWGKHRLFRHAAVVLLFLQTSRHNLIHVYRDDVFLLATCTEDVMPLGVRHTHRGRRRERGKEREIVQICAWWDIWLGLVVLLEKRTAGKPCCYLNSQRILRAYCTAYTRAR